MSERQRELQVSEEGLRLDRYLADHLDGLSRSAIQRLISSGQVSVNGELARPSYRVRSGDRLVVIVPTAQETKPAAEEIPLQILYEDEALLVIDKPPGMVVHPAPGHSTGTLVNALLALHPRLAQAGGDRPGIVHRLDRDTSGLILVATSEKMQRALQRQFQSRQVHKAYLALLVGRIQPTWGRIEAAVGRDPRHRQRMAIQPGGREAITEYHILERFAQPVGPLAGDFTLVEAEPITGRTHQIRVHFASIGHPIAGDPVYGRRHKRLPLGRQFLHAHRLEFSHPATGQVMKLESPLPADLAELLALLRSP
jgi:23S rRNA pseudouridine1911/1915/1917 synthase